MSVLLGNEVSELAWERAEAPHVLWMSGPNGCSDRLCGASNVLAQGCNDEHLRSTEQNDTRAAS